MNKWLAVKIFQQFALVLSVVLALNAGWSMAQNEQSDAGFSLPQISHNIDIELDNIFLSGLSEYGDAQHNQSQLGTVAPEALQLVGVLIVGEKKLAWIKTHDNALFELENGQQVPGSRFRIEHIFADSVALINPETCLRKTICDAMLFLELNR